MRTSLIYKWWNFISTCTFGYCKTLYSSANFEAEIGVAGKMSEVTE
jgi:hypothetical protein